ncbi:hypothetical protein [Psychrobacter phenylpyruvicus]|uniref:Uncharacterized protein n=2 Tax=Psychrobacter phenylpyruvicus TaxID=29432 RepID=A0A379LLF2_9GAMM|nr:hypothetical protein [Psychrobacter phenylpyruvicus]SUD90612.1 Uncharacterised protein [Psychrobacter phenylpyruvicus]
MNSTVTRKDGSQQNLFNPKKNQTVSVITHEDGTVSVGVSGTNPNVARRLQSELDKTYGEGKYNVSTSALNENNGIVRGEGPNGELGNKPGVCAEPACAMVAGNNPSPATGSATLWRGKDDNPHPYTDKDADILDNQQMDPCLTCAEPNNQQIYQDTAIPKRQEPNPLKGEE